ncbi:MAG: hypothetical protein QM776_10570 [Rhodocyclaceae bacterium]
MVNLRHALTHARRGDWEAAHRMVQADDSMLGAWFHGILHAQEGDLSNARYWYERAQRSFASRGNTDEELERLESELLD